uniref:Uncharacterized protein n=1 Tax=Rhizophora mucronata TaxID=61149 RepID=A0A2P2Q2N0_RHIMU
MVTNNCDQRNNTICSKLIRTSRKKHENQNQV